MIYKISVAITRKAWLVIPRKYVIILIKESMKLFFSWLRQNVKTNTKKNLTDSRSVCSKKGDKWTKTFCANQITQEQVRGSAPAAERERSDARVRGVCTDACARAPCCELSVSLGSSDFHARDELRGEWWQNPCMCVAAGGLTAWPSSRWRTAEGGWTLFVS